jgi:hypothetical protein
MTLGMECASIRILADHSEPDSGEMMIESEGEVDSCSLHHDETRGIDRGKPVKLFTLKVLPGLGEIAQLAWEDSNDARLMNGVLPGQADVPAGVAFQKSEGFDDHWN